MSASDRKTFQREVMRWLIVVGIVALLIVIILPALQRERENGGRVPCASNLRQIGLGILLYCNEYHGAYPPNLSAVLATQEITGEPFVCPKTNDVPLDDQVVRRSTTQQIIAADPLASGHHCSYIYVGSGLTDKSDADIVVAYEPLTNHDNDGSNILFVDGHISFEFRPVIQQIDADRRAGAWPIVIKNPATQPTR